MRESEIQPFVSLMWSGFQIILSFFRCHSLPLLVSHAISPHVVALSSDEEDNGDDVESYEDTIPSVIERGIVRPVYIGRDDVAKLNTHILNSVSLEYSRGRD